MYYVRHISILRNRDVSNFHSDDESSWLELALAFVTLSPILLMVSFLYSRVYVISDTFLRMSVGIICGASGADARIRYSSHVGRPIRKRGFQCAVEACRETR